MHGEGSSDDAEGHGGSLVVGGIGQHAAMEHHAATERDAGETAVDECPSTTG